MNIYTYYSLFRYAVRLAHCIGVAEKRVNKLFGFVLLRIRRCLGVTGDVRKVPVRTYPHGVSVLTRSGALVRLPVSSITKGFSIIVLRALSYNYVVCTCSVNYDCSKTERSTNRVNTVIRGIRRFH